jgi:signal transduction histidine kinase
MVRLIVWLLLLYPFFLPAKAQTANTTGDVAKAGIECVATHPLHEMDFPQLLQLTRSCVAAGRYNDALNAAIHARKHAKLNQKIEQQLLAMVAEASVVQYQGLYSEALKIYEQVKTLATPDYPLYLAKAENNLAHLLLSGGHAKEAEVLARSSVAKIESSSDPALLATHIGTLGAVQIKTRNLDEARTNIDRCIAISKKASLSFIQFYCLQSQAEVLLESGEAEKAYSAANAAIQLSERENVQSDLPDAYLSKAKAAFALGRFEESETLAGSAIKIAEHQQDPESAVEILKFMEVIYLQRKQLEQAYKATKSMQELSQKLYDKTLANAIAYQQVKSEVESKDKQIALLKSETELNAAEIKTAKAQRTIFILISVLLITMIFVGYSRWIHRRDLQRAQLSQQELHRLHELKDQFLANTTHELRTPLNGIIGLSDILQETEANSLSATGRNQLTLIRDCGAQLSEMVDSILSFSQIRAGKHLLKIEPVKLQQVISDVGAILLPLAQRKNLILSLNVENNELKVFADGDRLRQILTNLVGNAIKFTERGQVNVIAKRQNDQVIVTVKDTGIGIPEDRMNSIFEPFEQVDGSLRRRYGGVGLGLPIAKELVHAHGSELLVHSVPNVGTEFHFALSVA